MTGGSMSDDWMVIGRIVGPFGVRGEMKVEPLTDFPERFRSLKRVYLGDARREAEVLGSRNHKGQILLRLAGIDSPEAVKELRKPELHVPRAEAWSLPEGHYYLDDVIGLQVETTDGATIGEVTDVVRTGSNDVFVVGTGATAVLVPVIKDAVTELDMRARRVVIEPWVLTQV